MRTIDATHNDGKTRFALPCDAKRDGWALTTYGKGRWRLTHLRTGAAAVSAKSRENGRKLLAWWLGRGAELGCDWEQDTTRGITNQPAVRQLYDEYIAANGKPWLYWTPESREGSDD